MHCPVMAYVIAGSVSDGELLYEVRAVTCVYTSFLDSLSFTPLCERSCIFVLSFSRTGRQR